MAENVLETRIQLRYGTYSQWMNSDVILKRGEAAICAFPRERVIDQLSNITPENTPPAIGIKIGDGVNYFPRLPWVQAVAADVYNWAKQDTKPIYTAQEIQGLQSFVENLVGSDVEVNIAPRIYQLTRGTNENIDKWYLRYKENNEESPWVIDTSTYIDLADLTAIVNWIGRSNLEDYPTLLNRTYEQIQYFLQQLNKTDNARTHQFVTAVTEENGIISVERAQPSFEDLTGAATVVQGGTGKTSLPEDQVLVGNGTEPIYTIPIADSIANNNYLVPNRVIKEYVDNLTKGLTGAMHFIGEATVAITPNSGQDPRIGGYVFAQAEPGDVILSESKEYVWTGFNWRLLGDEGSYAIKGSIRDADIDPDADIQQSKIANLAATFDTKVDKVDGKTLTSNDFTDDLKSKLDGIEEGAQRNTIEHILKNGEEIRPKVIEDLQNAVNLEISEFTDEAQAKLDGIQDEAQVNKIERIIFDGEEVVPDSNKVVTITSDPHTEHVNKIEQIFINGNEQIPNANKQVRITIDQAALNLDVLEGAIIPDGRGGVQDVTQIGKKLDLARISVTGNVQDLEQTVDTYITLDCGSSTEVI